MTTLPRPLDILLVEDSPTDALLTREALEGSDVVSTVTLATHGEHALQRLYDSSRPRPDLVLLDLNLPGLSGLDVLVRIKSDVQLRTMPVVMLTTSADEDDVAAAYREYVNAYVRKPVDLDVFMTTVTAIGDFWNGVVTLPEESR